VSYSAVYPVSSHCCLGPWVTAWAYPHVHVLHNSRGSIHGRELYITRYMDLSVEARMYSI
jgi:hypothetical protein